MALDIDPSTFFAKCFATWLRLQILMAFMMAWVVMLLGFSAYLMQADGGDLSNFTYSRVSNHTSITTSLGYSNWNMAVCSSSPYVYLRPFQFNYKDSSGTLSTNASYCPYPYSNSVFRIVICVFSLVTTFVLFFKTPLSIFARQVWVVYALLFFAAFVLDIDASYTGYQTCLLNFGNTQLNADVGSAGITLVCDNTKYPGLTVLDLIVFSHFFLIYTAWALAKDHYAKKGEVPAYSPPAPPAYYPPAAQMPPPMPAQPPMMAAPAPAACQGWSPFSRMTGSAAAAAPAAPVAPMASTGFGGKGKTILQMQAEARSPIH